jgi:hypothetical protein
LDTLAVDREALALEQYMQPTIPVAALYRGELAQTFDQRRRLGPAPIAIQ